MWQRLNSDFHPKSLKGGGNFLFRAVIKILLVDLSRRENNNGVSLILTTCRSNERLDRIQRLLPLRSEGLGGCIAMWTIGKKIIDKLAS